MRRLTLIVAALTMAMTAAFLRGEEASRGATDGKSDLASLQGTWERTAQEGGQAYRLVKEISGNKETVTIYDPDGKVISAHTVDFKLEKRGGVKVFTFYNMQVSVGEGKGRKFPPTSYIYQVGDRFTEVWGLLPGQENMQPRMSVWSRPGSEAAAPVMDPTSEGERETEE